MRYYFRPDEAQPTRWFNSSCRPFVSTGFRSRQAKRQSVMAEQTRTPCRPANVARPGLVSESTLRLVMSHACFLAIRDLFCRILCLAAGSRCQAMADTAAAARHWQIQWPLLTSSCIDVHSQTKHIAYRAAGILPVCTCMLVQLSTPILVRIA